ncbi:hypothetical protein BSZ22_04975 [Bradyrhizobium canariense]|nr:hypothetical protein BSZ22_04975 [Bradyrhizobium canariense]OSI81865.1 hypothetical protein BSZ23_04495 [Bradyrhizobium canariense]
MALQKGLHSLLSARHHLRAGADVTLRTPHEFTAAELPRSNSAQGLHSATKDALPPDVLASPCNAITTSVDAGSTSAALWPSGPAEHGGTYQAAGDQGPPLQSNALASAASFALVLVDLDT